jgi:hypothetical protein
MNKKVFIFILLVFAVSMGLYAAKVGEITFIQGGVEIVRNGETLSDSDLDAGTAIENMDLIKTAKDGKLNFKLNSSVTPKAEIGVSSGTVFTVDVNKIGKTNATTLEMVSGNLSIKAQKLTGNMSLSVKTESATMGVRGTTFDVETAPAGDILVSCEEGKVECVDETGAKKDAEPGQVVEKGEDNAFKSIPVKVTDLKTWKKNWLAQKIEVFKADPLRAIRQFGRRYNRYLAEFNKAYDSLMGKRKILDKWAKEDKENKQAGKMEVMKEKKDIMRDLFKIRKVLFIFEKIYYRLNELYEYYQEGYGEGEIDPGLTTAKFFQKFVADGKVLENKMAMVRYITKMYSKRNEGAFPIGGLGDDSGDDGLDTGPSIDSGDDNFFND